MSLDQFTRIEVPGGTPAGSRELHVNHDTTACILDVAAAGAAPSTLSYDLTTGPGVGVDVGHYHYLTIRLGQLRDPTDQTTLDFLPEPQFIVRLTDGSGTVVEQDSATIYAAWKNPLAKPLFKEIKRGGTTHNATQMVLHTFAVEPSQMSGDAGDQTVFADLTDIVQLDIELSTGAGTGEIWSDSVQFVQK